MNRKNVYVEQRPQGDFAVRKAGSERASAIGPTQAKAIERAREISPGVAPDVSSSSLSHSVIASPSIHSLI